MSTAGRCALLAAAASLALGCGTKDQDPYHFIDTATDGAPDTTGLPDALADVPGPDGPGPDVPATDYVEEGCGGTTFEIERVIPDIIIVLDRSNSMSETPPSPPLWETIRTAINNVTTPPRDTSIWFGLMSFPGASCSGLTDQCIHPDWSEVLVPVAAENHLPIGNALAGLTTCGGTPIAMSLQSAWTYLTTLDNGHPKYVLLATDGAPNCNDALNGATCTCTSALGCTNNENCLDDERTYSVLDTMCDAGVSTYVLGMGGAAEWASVMNEMASHGCTDHYYAADDPASIAAALEEIAGAVATCQFEMNCADIPDPNKVNFFYEPDHTPIPRDTSRASGWDWVDPCEPGDETGLVECDNILSGSFESISAEFGCPTILI
jgi:hypothetical protein